MKVIVPLDFSENSLKALEFAVLIAGKKNGSVTLVHVINMVADVASQTVIALDHMFADGKKLLQEAVQRYQTPDVTIDYKIIEGNTPISVARVAAESDATLIVMGTQGASGLAKTLVGSTTVSLVQEARCPVLIVPSKANIYNIKKVTLALEFADHEEKFIDWIVDMSRRWELGLEILHVQSNTDFKEELAVLGMEAYLHKKYPDLVARIHTFYASSAAQGLELYMAEHDNMILVMCHQHRNLWEQIFQKSQSIEMAYHTHIPLLIMN